MGPSIIDLQRQKAAGPTDYRLPPTLGYKGHDVTKERAPAYTMRRRAPLPLRLLGPGPKYGLRPNLTQHGPGDPPAYTMRERLPLGLKLDVPGPGSYQPEKCTDASRPRAPAFSMGSRTMARLLDHLPGPAAYRPPDTVGRRVSDKPAAPAYSMRGWLTEPLYESSPGPAGYVPPPPEVYLRRAAKAAVCGRRPPMPQSARPGPDAYYPSYAWGRHTPAFSFRKRNSPLVMAFFLREDNP
ncbi:outer dense fiber protein 3-like protein 2 [Schistocerca gregaria]|uniref:outer dense fiber protein 3-like protein 2 n=1 Tax=Schistocerca gregaria TaxID=7010 RepID=UPI00211E08E6|nr:outer dense fiber protein 3-like protein 2 [Schistocerca gregaria]